MSRCTTCLRPALYTLYVFTVVLGAPVFLYWVVIPPEYLEFFYWVPFAFLVTTNLMIIIEGVLSIICCLYRYCRKRRYYVWNTGTGKYHIMYESDIREIIRYQPQTLVFPGSEPGPIDDHTIKISHDLPAMTIIVAAYLANERTIIEDTLVAMGRINYPGTVNVVLAYNTKPFDGQSDLMGRLEHLQKRYPTDFNGKVLHIINCPGSRSKAENINNVVRLMKRTEEEKKGNETKTNGTDVKEVHQRTGSGDTLLESSEVEPVVPSVSFLQVPDFVAIYDADHHPEVNSLIKAIYLMKKKKADILQGRCVVLNNQGWLSSIVAVEFNLIYILHHKGGEIVRGMGFFGGSNGIWSYQALSEIQMDPTMLTEDIDSSLRAIEAGYNIIYSTDVISYELAPTTVWALAKQRIRWAQGWFQVTLRHTCRILACDHISCWNKMMFMMLLVYREIFYYAAAQVIPVFVVSVFKGTYAYNPYLLISTGLSVCILPISLLVINTYLQLDVDRITPASYMPVSCWDNIKYLLAYPFYQYFKFIISVLSHFLEFMGNKEWRITNRTESMAKMTTPT